MSLNETKRNKDLPDIYLTEGISRSKSFAGLTHKRSNSADISFDGCVSVLSGGLGFVFGQGSNSVPSRNFLKGFSSSKLIRLHKAPTPDRAQKIFDVISKGLRDCKFLAETEVSHSKVALDAVSVSSQIKATERYLKRLEFQLTKLEELKEQYDIQQKMREGIRSMAYAYILSPGKEKESALHNVKSGFKECSDLMYSHESKLEDLMGTLFFEMKGIQGFARICCGDVFDVVVKHGDQKWKSRGRVIKNGQQVWENRFVLFKSLFNEPLYIKAVEVRGLGKNILLGNKYCEIRDLFSAHPQQMTINLNPSGSLKLNLLITWNPLHNVADGLYISTLPSTGLQTHAYDHSSLSRSSIAEDFSDISLTSKEAVPSGKTSVETFGFDYKCAIIPSQGSSAASADADFLTRTYENNVSTVNCDLLYSHASKTLSQSSHSVAFDLNSNDSQRLTTLLNEDSSDCCSIDIQSSSSFPQVSNNSLTQALKNLVSAIDDISKQYSELEDLSFIIDNIYNLLKDRQYNMSDSNVSISIESALGCFDFLNSAIENDESENIEEMSAGEKSTTTCEYESYETKLPFDCNEFSYNIDMNPLYLTTGNDQLDCVLSIHLNYCKRLITALSICSHLKDYEIISMTKLRNQTSCFTMLLKMMKEKSKDFIISDFFLENEVELLDMWKLITGSCAYSCSRNFCAGLENFIRSNSDSDDYLSSLAASRLLCQILDVSHFDSETLVSVLQFKLHFLCSEKVPTTLITETIADTIATEDLKCRDISKAINGVSVLSKISPSSFSLYVIGTLLVEDNDNLKDIVSKYLKTIVEDEQVRPKIISTYIDGLFCENPAVRIGSCAALTVLEVKNCSEYLSYISEKDSCPTVRDFAKNVLCKLRHTATLKA